MYGGKSIHPFNTDIYFTFTLEVRFTNLRVALYSAYQQFFYDNICAFREKGGNYTQVADWLNQNDYKTPRGKMFHGSRTFYR